MLCKLPICLLGTFVSAGLAALEGSMAPSIKGQVENENYWMNYNGMPVKDYVRELNKLKSLKIGVDPKLADLKTVPKLEFKDKNVVAGAEVLATALNVKVFYLRDFLYVAKDLPAGITPTYAGDPPKAEVQDPKNPPAAVPALKPLDAAAPVLTKLPSFPAVRRAPQRLSRGSARAPPKCERKSVRPRCSLPMATRRTTTLRLGSMTRSFWKIHSA